MNKLKTVIITGANSGLGLECAKNIAKVSNDYQIIIAARNKEKNETAKLEIIDETKNQNIIAAELDVSSSESVRKFVQSIKSSGFHTVYGLICNAGISGMKSKQNSLTSEGYDLVFGTNHLGHFLLSTLLLPCMETDGRIVVVSSDMHNPPGGIQWPGVKELISPTDERNIYSLSKLCNLYFTYELADRLKKIGSKITVNAFNPGLMTDTAFFEDKNFFTDAFLKSVSDRMGSSEKSSKAIADMMTGQKYSTVNASYIDRGKIVNSSDLSHNKENALELWETSVELTKLKADETLPQLI